MVTEKRHNVPFVNLERKYHQMKKLTLDNIEKIVIDRNSHFNECNTLSFLYTGLENIANTLKKPESAWDQKTGGRIKLNLFGRDINGSFGNLFLIANYFHWFGVSLCNYTRVVGFIRGLEKKDFSRNDLNDPTKYKTIKSSVDEYVKKVSELADVLKWRNKVAAHFAITAPHREDNPATLNMSVMFPVTFTNGRYRVGGMTLLQKNSSGTHTSEIPNWSVTEVFESLIPRFWNDISIRVIKPESDTQVKGIHRLKLHKLKIHKFKIHELTYPT